MTETSDYISMTATVDGVDQVACEMEQKWGVGRLRLLIDDNLRRRFDEQADLFNAALDAADVKGVTRHGDGMKRGWLALDQAAGDAGQLPLSPEVWEVKGPDGVIAIVRTNPEAHAIVREGRAVEVWTLDEIARIIVKFRDGVGTVKRLFPGAQVTDVREHTIKYAHLATADLHEEMRRVRRTNMIDPWLW